MAGEKIVFAFTTVNNGIANKLLNDVRIVYGDLETTAKAQWDTGATGSCISYDVVKSLKLVPTGKKNIQTPSGVRQVNTYLVNTILPNNVTINDVEVCDSEIGNQGIGMLVGMDIINLGDFALSNNNGQTVFSFRIPSMKKTDYVKEINLERLIGPKHGKGKRKRK